MVCSEKGEIFTVNLSTSSRDAHKSLFRVAGASCCLYSCRLWATERRQLDHTLSSNKNRHGEVRQASSLVPGIPLCVGNGALSLYDRSGRHCMPHESGVCASSSPSLHGGAWTSSVTARPSHKACS